MTKIELVREAKQDDPYEPIYNIYVDGDYSTGFTTIKSARHYYDILKKRYLNRVMPRRNSPIKREIIKTEEL